MNNRDKITSLSSRKRVEMRPGLVKTNLSFNNEMMMCHFTMKKGSKLDIHNHLAVQNGYVISGRLRYEIADGNKKVVEAGFLDAGSGYVWDSLEYHSTEAVEDTEFIECFSPMRAEYVVVEDLKQGAGK